MFKSTTLSPFLPNRSFINDSNTVVSKSITAQVAPTATIFFISAVPNSFATPVNGKLTNCALLSSGFCGFAFSSAIIMLPSSIS